MRIILSSLALVILGGCAAKPIQIGQLESESYENIVFEGNPYRTYKTKINNRVLERKRIILETPYSYHIRDESLSMPFANYIDKNIPGVTEKVIIDKALIYTALSKDEVTKYRMSGQGLLVDAIANNLIAAQANRTDFIYEENSVVCNIVGKYKSQVIKVHEHLPFDYKPVDFPQNNESIRAQVTDLVEKCSVSLNEAISSIEKST